MKKYGDQVRTAALDVADEDAARAAVRVAVGAFGRLDVVVNNAGYGDVAPFEQLSAERFKAVVDTNFYGVVNVTRAARTLARNCERTARVCSMCPSRPDLGGHRPFVAFIFCQSGNFPCLWGPHHGITGGAQGDPMTHIPFLFNQTIEQIRRIGARGGKAHARNWQARQRAAGAESRRPPYRPRRRGRPPPKPWRFWIPNLPGCAVPRSLAAKRQTRLPNAAHR